jgi:hypothetical protein
MRSIGFVAVSSKYISATGNSDDRGDANDDKNAVLVLQAIGSTQPHSSQRTHENNGEVISS